MEINFENSWQSFLVKWNSVKLTSGLEHQDHLLKGSTVFNNLRVNIFPKVYL